MVGDDIFPWSQSVYLFKNKGLKCIDIFGGHKCLIKEVYKY